MNAIRFGATIKSYLIVRLASSATDARNCQGKLDSSSLGQSQSVTGCNRLKLSIGARKYRKQFKITLARQGSQSVTNCHRLKFADSNASTMSSVAQQPVTSCNRLATKAFDVPPRQAPKVRNVIAQGNALGLVATTDLALKGRHNHAPQPVPSPRAHTQTVARRLRGERVRVRGNPSTRTHDFPSPPPSPRPIALIQLNFIGGAREPFAACLNVRQFRGKHYAS